MFFIKIPQKTSIYNSFHFMYQLWQIHHWYYFILFNFRRAFRTLWPLISTFWNGWFKNWRHCRKYGWFLIRQTVHNFLAKENKHFVKCNTGVPSFSISLFIERLVGVHLHSLNLFLHSIYFSFLYFLLNSSKWYLYEMRFTAAGLFSASYQYWWVVRCNVHYQSYKVGEVCLNVNKKYITKQI